MQEWLDVAMPDLNIHEQYNFDKALAKVKKNFSGWNEEDLKIKFIGPILELGCLIDDETVIGYFDKTISAVVENIKCWQKAHWIFLKRPISIFKNTNLSKIHRVIQWHNC
jgi:hypothetical protein